MQQGLISNRNREVDKDRILTWNYYLRNGLLKEEDEMLV